MKYMSCVYTQRETNQFTTSTTILQTKKHSHINKESKAKLIIHRVIKRVSKSSIPEHGSSSDGD